MVWVQGTLTFLFSVLGGSGKLQHIFAQPEPLRSLFQRFLKRRWPSTINHIKDPYPVLERY